MTEKFLNSNNLETWEKAASKHSPAGDVKNLKWDTPEGLAVKALYTKADLAGLEFADTLPGFAPYLRGPQPTMYAVKPWTIRQYAGFSIRSLQCFLPQGAGRWWSRCFGGFRPGNPSWLRFR